MDILFTLNGDITASVSAAEVVRNKVICSLKTSTENSGNNAWNLNFSDGNINNNNNNKNNSNVVRCVCALGVNEKTGWILAYKDCCRHKKSSKDCVRYRTIAYRDLYELMYEVYTKTYEPTINRCFVVTRPKPREVFAANFRDRIVQHWIMLRLRPLFEERFISQGNVSFNCRKGFGSLRAVNTLQKDIEIVSKMYSRPAYIGKFDLKSFFMSINKYKVLDLLIPFIEERYEGDDKDILIYLVKKTILNCPQKNCFRTSPEWKWGLLPDYKSLFHLPDWSGLAIGNITSQEIANFLMSFFDAYMLAECAKLGALYIRFVDDFVVICNDKAAIVALHRKATIWLRDNLGLTLHQDKFYLQEVSKGVKFIGSVIKPYRRYTSNSTVCGFNNRVYDLEKLCSKIHDKNILKLKFLQKSICSVSSYMGFLVHNNSYALRRKLFSNTPNFWKYCYIDKKFSAVHIKKEFNYNIKLFNLTNNYELELSKGIRDAA